MGMRPIFWSNADYHFGMAEEKMNYVQAILMFGPSHGTCTKVVEGTPWVAAIDSEPPDVIPMNYATPAELIAATRIHRHVYHYHDVMSSPNGEDVVIYVHDENCCEKVMSDDTNASLRTMR